MRGLEIPDRWRFFAGEPECPHLPETDDTGWRELSVPHDWSIEQPFSREKGSACTGFLPGGTGWYRKHLKTEPSWADSRVIMSFDGIYNRASIYCNGALAAFHPYGYSPVNVDLTDYLSPEGEDNVIAVGIDHSRYADSRWYTGSGIYRKVSLHILPRVHIPVWGVYITTPEVTDKQAKVKVLLKIQNSTEDAAEPEVSLQLYNPRGVLIDSTSEVFPVSAAGESEPGIFFDIPAPEFWEIHDGQRYRVDICLGNQRVSEYFGIRKFRFDAAEGFFFNGRKTIIKGVCLHHDAGLAGAAVPLDIWRRRLEKLKEAGCNAIRTAHNPASEDFLELCDQMGFLVQEEFFDEWDNPKDKEKNGEQQVVQYKTQGHEQFFREYARLDLQNTMLRDRNHPCIIQWSIGNEIEWTYTHYNEASGYFTPHASGYYWWTLPPFGPEKTAQRVRAVPSKPYDIGSTAARLSAWTKELDTTRPVTANCILPTVSYETGFTEALDLVGYSYRGVLYPYGREHYPDKPVMGTENVPQWHEWKAVLDNPHISGLFLWTGIDHLGEAWVQKPWPRKNSNLGLLDLAGFPKQPWHLFKGLWTSEPHQQIYTRELELSPYKNREGRLVEREEGAWSRRDWHWHEMNRHWNYSEGEMVVVEVISNCEEVTLYLDDEPQGTRLLCEQEDRLFKWAVAWAPGCLKVCGIKDGMEDTVVLHTAGEPACLNLLADKKEVSAHADSAVHLEVQIADSEGHPVRHRNARIDFTVDGPAFILGTDNGHPDSIQGFRNSFIETSEGRGLVVIQAESGTSPDSVRVKAACPELGLESPVVTIVPVQAEVAGKS